VTGNQTRNFKMWSQGRVFCWTIFQITKYWRLRKWQFSL